MIFFCLLKSWESVVQTTHTDSTARFLGSLHSPNLPPHVPKSLLALILFFLRLCDILNSKLGKGRDTYICVCVCMYTHTQKSHIIFYKKLLCYFCSKKNMVFLFCSSTKDQNIKMYMLLSIFTQLEKL